MKQLSDLIPNWEDLLRLEPEQLAGILLEILLEIDGNDRQFFHRGNFFNQFAAPKITLRRAAAKSPRRLSKPGCTSNARDSSSRV